MAPKHDTEKRCGGSRTITRRDDRWCDCILTEHCPGRQGKNGARCRWQRFGADAGGSIGSAPKIKEPCPGCPDCEPATTEGVGGRLAEAERERDRLRRDNEGMRGLLYHDEYAVVPRLETAEAELARLREAVEAVRTDLLRRGELGVLQLINRRLDQALNPKGNE